GMADQDHRRLSASGLPGFVATGLLIRSAMQPEAKSLREYLAPLGVPLLIIADDPQLLATAVAAYAEWRSAIALDPVLELRLRLGTTPSHYVSSPLTARGA